MSDLESIGRHGFDVDSNGYAASSIIMAMAPPEEAPDLAGSFVGPYELGRLLGQGATGTVYEAIDTRPTSCRYEHTVALKILEGDFDASAPLVREAQLLADLAHEHIVPVYEVGEDEGILYLAMKCMDGGRLPTPEPPSDRKGRELHARKAAVTTLQIALAVGCAHRHGVLHRDLKPANVLVDGEGRAFVTDFGLAALQALIPSVDLAPGGTPPYMAPEVWRTEKGAASTQADVWGLGAILYELLRGHPPFDASSWDALEQKITTEPPPPLDGVHPDLAAVCLHCLEKDPSRRYTMADDLAADLTRFLADEPVSREAREVGFVARWLRRAQRHPVIAVLSALLVVAAIHAVVSRLYLSRAREAAFRSADVTARSLSRLTALQFDRLATVVEAVGKDPRTALALADPSSSKASDECARLSKETAGPAAGLFATWFLLDQTGKGIGIAPAGAHDTMGRSFQFRDYFHGVDQLEKEHLRKAYVSRAFRSERDDDYEIAISFAVHDSADRWVGVIAATLETGSAFGSIELEDPADEDFTAALLAPRSVERGETATPPDLVFLKRRMLPRGAGLSAGTGNALGASLDSTGLVRLVPVRGTPFSVLVRVAYDGLWR